MRRMSVRFALCCVVLFGATSCDLISGLFGDKAAFAANVVPVTENITVARTWDAQKVYFIDQTIEVSTGASLTIPAGTVIKFSASGALEVADGATLNANGTVDKPIIFTSIKDDSAGGDSALDGTLSTAAANDWRGLWLRTGAVGTFANCGFRYAGAGNSAALYLNGSANVSNCTFRNNGGGLSTSGGEAALDARDTAAGTVITGNLFYSNHWPLAVSSNFNLGSSNTFSYTSSGTTLKNTYQAIFLEGDEVKTTISWLETEVPFVNYTNSPFEVAAGASLTLGAGVVVKFCGSNSGINISDGASFAPGSAIFTDFRDDTRGGDSNADGAATAPAAASWYGVYNYHTSEYITSNVFYAANL